MATNKELYAQLNAILKEADAKVVEAEKFAEANQLSFSYGQGAEITYYPHSDKIRCETKEGFEENYMVTGEDDEAREVVPLVEHESHYFQGGYDEIDDFHGGWWIPSRYC